MEKENKFFEKGELEVEKTEDKSRETIWGINPKYRGWFYGVVSIYGSVLTLLTLFQDHKSWVEKLNEVGYSVVATVATVWFLFQTGDWIMAFGDVLREKARKIAKKRLDKERARIQARVTSALREKGASEDLIGAAQMACFPENGSQFGKEASPKERE